MKLCINCRSFSTSTSLKSDETPSSSDETSSSSNSESEFEPDGNDSEREFDVDGREAAAYRKEMLKDLKNIDKAREGNSLAETKLYNKY